MKKANREAINALLKGDPTVTDHQRQSAIAIADGKPAPTQSLVLRQLEVAELLGVSRQTVWMFTKRGILKPVHITDGIARYRRDDVMALIKGE